MVPWRAGCGETHTSGSEGGPGKRTVGNDGTTPRARPYRLAQRQLPFPETHVPGCSRGKGWTPMGRLSGRFALVDGFHLNRWTIWIGIGGRFGPERVDDFRRNDPWRAKPPPPEMKTRLRHIFSMPQRLFWLDSSWASAPTGLDVDFVRKPTAGSGVVTAKIHGWNVGVHQYGANTKLYHRGLGDPSFLVTSMVRQADQITWRADISSYYSPGETIEYYIETMRSDLSGTLNASKKVYRPVYYKMDWDGTKWVGVPPVEYWLTTR